jgi:hypothetical protein
MSDEKHGTATDISPTVSADHAEHVPEKKALAAR